MRWQRVRDERAALVGPNLGDGVELAIHPRELGLSFGIGELVPCRAIMA